MVLTSLIFTALAAVAGLLAGGFVPEAGEKLMAYKSRRKSKEYPVLGSCLKRRWLYAPGVAACWAASVFEPSLMKAVFVAALSFLMFVITYLDNRYRIIPNEGVAVVLAVGLAYGAGAGGLAGIGGSLAAAMIGAAVCLAAAALTRGKKAVGAGDVKLMAACCCVAGMPGAMDVLIYMAAALGVYCIGGLTLKRLTLSSYFPMGGFIAMGLVLSLYPQQLNTAIRMIDTIMTGG